MTPVAHPAAAPRARPTRTPGQLLAALVLLASLAPIGSAQFAWDDVPVSGASDPALAILDVQIAQEMANANPQVTAATVAIMYQGRVMYERGFGWMDRAGGDLTPVPANARMRVASVTKPFTGAAIMRLVNDGELGLPQRVFDYGGNGGILKESSVPGEPDYSPYNGVLGDARLLDITVEDLLLHRGGFDRGLYHPNWGYDPQFSNVAIQNAMDLDHPADAVEITRFMMAQALDYTPGADPTPCYDDDAGQILMKDYCYSNFGFLLLGQIIEEVTGMDQVAYIQDRILSTWGGVASELQHGRTFAQDQDPSEPVYESEGQTTNVFDPDGPSVPWPYGGWHQEAFTGHGDLVSNTVQILHLMDRYRAFTDYHPPFFQPPIPIGSTITSAPSQGSGHNGSLPGTYSIAFQQGDLAIAIIANRRNPDMTSSGGETFATNVRNRILAHPAVLDPINWPDTYANDNWADLGASPVLEFGTYQYPETTVPSVLGIVQHGGRVKFKPSTTSWTGTIDQSVILAAPQGAAVIGSL